MRIAPEADLELPSAVLNGSVAWTIEAGRSLTGRRPRIRFRPDRVGSDQAPLRWSVLLTLRSGKLQLRGMDLVLPASAELQEDRVAAFGIGTEAELTLADCTLTLLGKHPSLAAVVVLPESDGPREGRRGASARPARIELRDSFIRSGEDFLALPTPLPGGIEVNLLNSLLVADGCLVHAQGTKKASGDRPGEQPGPIRLSLDRVTVRTKQGLVRLESSHTEPDLPVANIVARDSILCLADPANFLFHVEGHDRTFNALRDYITWDGTRVAYHQIVNYRRDEDGQTGSRPRDYNRQAWANVAKDSDPIYENIQFEKWEPARPAWTLSRGDLRPTDETKRSHDKLGPDLAQIPAPPAAE